MTRREGDTPPNNAHDVALEPWGADDLPLRALQNPPSYNEAPLLDKQRNSEPGALWAASRDEGRTPHVPVLLYQRDVIRQTPSASARKSQPISGASSPYATYPSLPSRNPAG